MNGEKSNFTRFVVTIPNITIIINILLLLLYNHNNNDNNITGLV